MTENILSIKNLNKTFISKAGKVVAASDISLDIPKGSIFGIIGKSGAGKSTLLRIFNRLESADSGEVYLDGKNLLKLKGKELRKQLKDMGMVFQSFNLLEQKNVFNNVLFPLTLEKVKIKDFTEKREKDKKRVLELLELVNLKDKEKEYPSRLSGGQKQRVAIARALATNPKVLLLDELTSALDEETTNQILELLKDINKKLGVTILIITHEMRVVEQICTHIAVIEKGKLVESGDIKNSFFAAGKKETRELYIPSFSENAERCCRIVFDSKKANEAVIADLILSTGEAVNILFADTRRIGGEAVGQMVIQLPESKKGQEKVLEHLKKREIIFEELEGYNG